MAHPLVTPIQLTWDDFSPDALPPAPPTTVYIDEPMWGVKAFGHTGWAHLIVGPETDLEVLHKFASDKPLGIARKWFQWHNPMFPHYDVTCDQVRPGTPSRWDVAVSLGAVVLHFHEGQTAAATGRRIVACEHQETPGALPCAKPSSKACSLCRRPFCHAHALTQPRKPKTHLCCACLAQRQRLIPS